MEKTLILLKPDAFKKRVLGEIIHRIERAGGILAEARIFAFDQNLAEKFYGEHKGKPFYPPLLNFMTSGRTMGLVVEKENAIAWMRKLVGATDPANADPGTIRYDYATNGRENAIHASDSAESFEREYRIIFSASLG